MRAKPLASGAATSARVFKTSNIETINKTKLKRVMKTKSKIGLRGFQMKVLYHGNHYYIDRIADLEKALAKKPRRFQIDLIGAGEIPADWALLIRSILIQRAPQIQLITNARSSLQGGTVLVWLLGDRRIIRDDARLFFRRVEMPGADEPDKTDKAGPRCSRRASGSPRSTRTSTPAPRW